MKIIKKSLIFTMVVALLFCTFTFCLNTNKVYAQENARNFNSEESFSSVVNGNNNFYAMYGQEGQVDTFKNCTNKLADSVQQYWQGSDSSFNLVGKTKMLIGLPNNEVSVRAFKAPLSGSVTMVVTANLDSDQHENTENLQVYNGTTLLEDFTVSSTTAINKTYTINVNKGGYIFVSLHDNNGASVSNTATHVVMDITYTATTDAEVLALNSTVENLPSVDSVTNLDYNAYNQAYLTYASKTALEQSFVVDSQKLLNGYDKALGLFVNEKIASLPSNITYDNLQEINELYVLVCGMSANQKSYISSQNLSKYESAVALSEKMLSLNDLYDLIDNIPDDITLMDKYQISVAYNKYQQLDADSLSVIDKQREQKLLDAVKTIYDLENPSQSSSSSSSVSSTPSSSVSSTSSKEQSSSSTSSVVSSSSSQQVSSSSKEESSSSVSSEVSSTIEESSSSVVSSSSTESSSSASANPTPSKRGGCGSSINGGIVILGGLVLLVFIRFVKKAKRN